MGMVDCRATRLPPWPSWFHVVSTYRNLDYCCNCRGSSYPNTVAQFRCLHRCIFTHIGLERIDFGQRTLCASWIIECYVAKSASTPGREQVAAWESILNLHTKECQGAQLFFFSPKSRWSALLCYNLTQTVTIEGMTDGIVWLGTNKNSYANLSLPSNTLQIFSSHGYNAGSSTLSL